MHLFKRVICGLVALVFIASGIALIGNSEHFLQALGFCIFVVGIALGYITIKQRMPSYSFWITLIAIGLAISLYMTKTPQTQKKEDKQIVVSTLESELEKSKDLLDNKETHRKERKQTKKKKKSGFNMAQYPKISGSATVIHAHILYVAGRYVRLFGIDAPDNDQMCSDAEGVSYNCGEVAASWLRGWIDKNSIDCYLLKIEPNGQDSAVCIWGEYDIGAALVGAGWAIANYKESDIYGPYETKAKRESSGLWQGTFFAPEDWRDIKRHRSDFSIKRSTTSKGGFFDFGSWF